MTANWGDMQRTAIRRTGSGPGRAARPGPGRAVRRRSRRAVRRRALPFLAVPLAAATLLAAGCGSGADPAGSNPAAAGSDVLGPLHEAKGTPVKIGMVSDGKYPASDASVEGRVADAVVKWINERQGGLGGRPIQLVRCEDQGDPARAADCGNQMVEQGVAAVLAGGPAFPEPVWQPVNAANIPMVFYGVSSDKILSAQNTYVFADPVFSVVGLPADAAVERGAKKVTAIVIDIPAAVNIYRTQAPPVFAAKGVSLDLVTVPPDQADMTPQAQRVQLENPDGVTFVVGGEPFCTAAFNALHAVGYTGQVVSITQCLGDSTHKAVPGEFLNGMVIGAQAPVGGQDPGFKLFQAIATTYGHDIDTGNGVAIGMYVSVAGFSAALQGVSPNDLTPAGISATMRRMPEIDLPGAGGVKFRCNGKANPQLPAVCVRGGLTTTLNDEGLPTTYKAIGQTPIEG